MRLIDLEPRWYVLEDGGPVVGLTFDCPHCRQERLGVKFHHRGHEAMEDAHIMAKAPTTNHIWTLDGDSFENLTLSPSVDASASGHWHGFIANGDIR
jgi:hypothetical protein